MKHIALADNFELWPGSSLQGHDGSLQRFGKALSKTHTGTPVLQLRSTPQGILGVSRRHGTAIAVYVRKVQVVATANTVGFSLQPVELTEAAVLHVCSQY